MIIIYRSSDTHVTAVNSFMFMRLTSATNIKENAQQQVATANTSSNSTHVYQVIVRLSKQIDQIAGN
jgi:hypothetical protein